MFWLVAALLLVVYFTAGHVIWLAWSQSEDARRDYLSRSVCLFFWFPLYFVAMVQALRETYADRR